MTSPCAAGTLLANQSIVALAVGVTHDCAIDKDARAWCWADGSFGYKIVDSQVAAIAVGGGHACALKLSGQAWCYGACQLALPYTPAACPAVLPASQYCQLTTVCPPQMTQALVARGSWAAAPGTILLNPVQWLVANCLSH